MVLPSRLPARRRYPPVGERRRAPRRPGHDASDFVPGPFISSGAVVFDEGRRVLAATDGATLFTVSEGECQIRRWDMEM